MAIWRCTSQRTVRDGPIGRAMPGRVPTEWTQLLGMSYYDAVQIICRERPDVYIEEHQPGDIIPPGPPYDDKRVRVYIDSIFLVAPPAPVVG
ncbi:unnamed protein product [Urochloa decumbens]|uniref:Uncharacterized protein n=1 Tax=Urochloa decumbens TaxID=240449 RepID=A0ABC9G0X5_9POAL